MHLHIMLNAYPVCWPLYSK